MDFFTAGIIILFIIKRAFSIFLELINVSYLRKMGSSVPAQLSGLIDRSTAEKSLSYLVLKSRFGIFRSLFSDILVFIFIFTPLLNIYNSALISLNINFILKGLIYFMALSVVSQFLDIPFSLYETFFIENKYGFNRMNLRLWAADYVKSFIIDALLLCGAIIALLWVVQISPMFWWGIMWLFFFTLSIMLMYISPFIIEPLFNKFTPLDNLELVEKIRALFAKVGIEASQVTKIDASKRSTHSNAYFTGIGKVKRIVIFDTLLSRLSDDEILAVLAHEAGHWKKKHILKSIALYEAVSLVLFFGCFLLFRTEILPALFHITAGGFFVKTILAGFIGSILAFFLSPIVSYISRRREMEADRFSVDITGGSSHLQDSLVKLSRDNLSNLYPHPLYVFFYYSHPPLLERLNELTAYYDKK